MYFFISYTHAERLIINSLFNIRVAWLRGPCPPSKTNRSRARAHMPTRHGVIIHLSYTRTRVRTSNACYILYMYINNGRHLVVCRTHTRARAQKTSVYAREGVLVCVRSQPPAPVTDRVGYDLSASLCTRRTRDGRTSARSRLSFAATRRRYVPVRSPALRRLSVVLGSDIARDRSADDPK